MRGGHKEGSVARASRCFVSALFITTVPQLGEHLRVCLTKSASPLVSLSCSQLSQRNQELWLSLESQHSGNRGRKISVDSRSAPATQWVPEEDSFYKINISAWVWWLTPSIPSTREVETGWLSDLKAIPGYTPDSRPSRAM